MNCPRCQHENPQHAKFCLECGVSLALTCAKCHTALPAGAKFCLECGEPVTAGHGTSRFAAPESYTPKYLAEKILTSKSALEGERKHVTILFADLKSSMELLADRDPEEARKLLDAVVIRMMEAVHRYEGTVNEVRGDGIMALFGAPVAHEDHAVRACYAALRMQQAVKRYANEVRGIDGPLVQIRVGINSGEVVVRSIGSDLRMDYSAVGRTTHLAARMEQVAAPGTIRITPETLRLVEGLVEVTPLGPIPIKGLGEPIEVFELMGASAARTRFEAAARRGLTRYVGRSAEMEQIRGALDRASSGRGQVVTVVGDPGVGKSRLVWEVIHSHHVHRWRVLKSGSVPSGKSTSYLPVIDLLKGYFGIEARDGLREIREKVTGALLRLDDSLKPALLPLLALLDVPVDDAAWKALDPGQRRRRTLDAVKQALLREAREQPLLLIFEDLHWIDGGTQALLDSLIESLPAARVLLLVNYRPEYSHPWGSKTYQLRIDPLPPESAEELLNALLGPDADLGPLKRLLVERTEANPLFLEESVRALAETGALTGKTGAYRLAQPIGQLKIPGTVQAILAARIDRLAPEEKRLLQAVAVIGKDVPMALLLAIADAPEYEVRAELARLQAAEFLYEVRLFPDLEYTFKHALTHEVAYQGLLQDRRRDLHARITEAIERLAAERIAEQSERLAHHALRGELWEKAVHYLREAGLKAAARSALSDSRAWLEQALGVLDAMPSDQTTLEHACDIRLELRPVLNQLGEVRQALERLREAGRFSERLNDDRRQSRVSAFISNSRAILGELDEALVSGTRALEIARRLGELSLLIPARTSLEQTHYYRGDYERVVKLATDNLTALPPEWVSEYFGATAPAAVVDRYWLLMSLAQLGQFAEAREHEAEILRLAGLTHHAFSIGQAYRAAGTLHMLKGEWERACELIQKWVAQVRTGSVALTLSPGIAFLAWALAQLGETIEAIGRIEEGQHLLERQARSGIMANLDYYALGRACLLLGRLDEAQRFGDRGAESSASHPGFAAYSVSLLGDIATHLDRFDAERAQGYYRTALALAEPRGMRPLIANCHLSLGKLYRRTGEREQAQEHIVIATTMYREMDMPFWLDKAEGEVRQL
jgi:class 3 adenylate cyclase/tetratricopeptide (TPR) repeat protein